jgi:uncharacterized membrane protein YfcA
MSFPIGLLAGLFGGLLGIGGGFVMIPFMVGVMKLTQIKAHGTSLAAMIFLALSGAATYGLQGSVDIPASGILAFSATLAAHYGARYASFLSERKLKRSFGIFLVIAAGLLFLKPYLPPLALFAHGLSKVLVLLGTGAVTGFLSGMMGVGGAVVMIPAMVVFAGIDQHTAQGSSLLTMIPAGIVGAFTHLRFGNVEKSLLWGLIPGVFMGTYLGGTIAHRLPDQVLRVVFAMLVTWTAYVNIRAKVPNGL